MSQPQFHARVGTLQEQTGERPGAQEWQVRLEDGQVARAIAYTAFGAHLRPGFRVWLNTTAMELNLGTGGAHFILAPLFDSARPNELEMGAMPEVAAGHITKLRYTPLQHAVLAVEEEASPGRAEVMNTLSLGGLPVVAAELHSSAMAVAVAAHACGARRVVYVMTDGGALPLSFSLLVARLRSEQVLAGTITAGQAFGGDLEAVTVASALAAARAVFDAEVIVVSQGPGNAGTGSPYGFSGLAQAEHLHAAAALEGRSVAVLRVSFADPRPRHRGLSHHTATVLGRMVLTGVTAAVPDLPPDWSDALRQAIEAADLPRRHGLRCVPADDLLAALAPYRDLMTTMGRTIDEDRAYFLSACAAARLSMDPTAGRPWP